MLVVLAIGIAATGCKGRRFANHKDLHYMARNGDVSGVRRALWWGADINAQDEHGDTPLHGAVLQRRTDMIAFLADWGADLNRKNKGGLAPIWSALTYHDHATVQLLLDRGADPNSVGRDGLTPVMYAMQWDWRETVQSLVDAGAEVTIHVAAYVGDTDRIQTFLAANTSVDEGDWQEHTPLHWAARGGCLPAVAILLEHGADVNAQDEHGGTALSGAIWDKHPAVVKALLATGANANLGGDMRYTALDWLVFRAWDDPTIASDPVPYREMAGELLAHGAVMSQAGGGNESLLSFAVRYGFVDIVRQVLARGNVKLNGAEVHMDFFVPLVHAAESGYTDIAELLLANGVDANVRAPNRKTILHIAAGRNDQRLATLLLARGADVNARDSEGKTPLHEASVGGHREMVESLVGSGAGLDVADVKGNTALHYAARGYPDVVQLLLAKGASVNVVNADGDTPLHNAALRGNKEVVRLLLAGGADRAATNNEGRTPANEAARRGYRDVVALLEGTH